jgi:starch phosphorylase
MGRQLVDWRRALEEKWASLRFGEVKAVSEGGKHLFEVEVYLGSLDPDSVRVELYAEGADGDEPVRQGMTQGRQITGTNGYIYSVQVPAVRPAADYTPRVIPEFPGAAIPLEASRILWQR